MMLYKPGHFDPWEVFQGLTEVDTWDALDPLLRAQVDDKILITADQIRDLIGPFTVNNYLHKGTRGWCGVRDSRCPEYSISSMHSDAPNGVKFRAIPFGPCGAMDGHHATLSAESVRQILRDNRDKLPYLGRLEINVPWFHFDIGPRNADGTLHEFSK